MESAALFVIDSVGPDIVHQWSAAQPDEGRPTCSNRDVS